MSTEIKMTAEIDAQTGQTYWTAAATTFGATTHDASAETVEGALYCLAANLYAEFVGQRQHGAAEALADQREAAFDSLDPAALAALEASRARIRQREAEQAARASDDD